jgi:toxin-antitoxin system PIN domain toxin
VFVVDTNILVYAADADSPFHQACHAQLQTWRAQTSAWCLTWSILYEFLRVTTHPRVFRQPWAVARAWEFAEAILASPGLSLLVPTDRHAAVAAEVFAQLPHASGNTIFDAQIAILMREHGIRRIYTRDTDFHRFPFLEPLDPTA